MGFLTTTHDESIESHQSFYNEDFEVVKFTRKDYFEIFPLSVLIAYASPPGGGNWDGLISTDGKKIVITKSSYFNGASNKKSFEHSLSEIESIAHKWNEHDIKFVFKNNIKGLTMSEGNQFLKYVIFFCTFSLAYMLQSFLFRGNILEIDPNDEFGNLDKFKSLLNL